MLVLICKHRLAPFLNYSTIAHHPKDCTNHTGHCYRDTSYRTTCRERASSRSFECPRVHCLAHRICTTRQQSLESSTPSQVYRILPTRPNLVVSKSLTIFLVSGLARSGRRCTNLILPNSRTLMVTYQQSAYPPESAL